MEGCPAPAGALCLRARCIQRCAESYILPRIDDGEAFIDSGDFLKTWTTIDGRQPGKRYYQEGPPLVSAGHPHRQGESGEYTSWITGTVDQVTQLSEDGTKQFCRQMLRF